MALDASVCGTAVHNAIQALSAADQKDPETVWQTAVQEIFDHIAANAVVTVPVQTTDTGLQSYSAGGPPVATTGPLVNTSLDGTIA